MTDTASFTIGVDLGGTNVRAGVVSSTGELLTARNTPIEASLGPGPGLQKIIDLIQEVISIQAVPLSGIGIGAPGPLDRARGCIQNPYTLPGWEDVDIITPLQAKFGVPVSLENDADAAALGEAWTGAGRGLTRLAMITIGTGVGSALVYNGEIYRGVGGAHPEGGHIMIDPAGPKCYCGANGCWESLVAGPAIAQFARCSPDLVTSSIDTACDGQSEHIDAAQVFAAARAGDALARQLVTQTATYIGLGLVNVMMLYLPDCIVLTGGVIRSYELMADTVQAVVARHNVVIPAEQVQIRLAQLGQQAGVIGAARAAQLLAGSAR